MKAHKSEAIVLHSYPSRERDKLVVFLTPEQGKMRGWAYGARSMKSRFGSALEPLTKVEFGYFEKEGEEAVRLDSVSLLRSMFDVQQELRSSFALTYLAEMIDTFAQPSESSPVLYRLLDGCCDALSKGDEPLRVVVYFEIWMLRLNGIFPSMTHCIECHDLLDRPLRFEEDRAGFVCGRCARRAEIVPNDVADVLQHIVRLPIGDFACLTLRPELIFETRRLARQLRRHFLGHELKSYDVLQGVL